MIGFSDGKLPAAFLAGIGDGISCPAGEKRDKSRFIASAPIKKPEFFGVLGRLRLFAEAFDDALLFFLPVVLRLLVVFFFFPLALVFAELPRPDPDVFERLEFPFLVVLALLFLAVLLLLFSWGAEIMPAFVFVFVFCFLGRGGSCLLWVSWGGEGSQQ